MIIKFDLYSVGLGTSLGGIFFVRLFERNVTDYMDFCQMDSITLPRNKTIFPAGQFNRLFPIFITDIPV